MQNVCGDLQTEMDVPCGGKSAVKILTIGAEGRREPSDGTLMCSYHGWRFNGEGKCTDIPQSLDAKANAAACNNPRSCATARPTKVVSRAL